MGKLMQSTECLVKLLRNVSSTQSSSNASSSCNFSTSSTLVSLVTKSTMSLPISATMPGSFASPSSPSSFSGLWSSTVDVHSEPLLWNTTNRQSASESDHSHFCGASSSSSLFLPDSSNASPWTRRRWTTRKKHRASSLVSARVSVNQPLAGSTRRVAIVVKKRSTEQVTFLTSQKRTEIVNLL